MSGSETGYNTAKGPWQSKKFILGVFGVSAALLLTLTLATMDVFFEGNVLGDGSKVALGILGATSAGVLGQAAPDTMAARRGGD